MYNNQKHQRLHVWEYFHHTDHPILLLPDPVYFSVFNIYLFFTVITRESRYVCLNISFTSDLKKKSVDFVVVEERKKQAKTNNVIIIMLMCRNVPSDRLFPSTYKQAG